MMFSRSIFILLSLCFTLTVLAGSAAHAVEGSLPADGSQSADGSQPKYLDGSQLKGKAKKVHLSIVSQTPIYDDPALSEYVSRVGNKLLENSHHAGREYHFFVLDDPGVNAFTPGYGLIYFNRGLLNLLTSEGQLAGVLAHEIGHNTGRHIARRKSKQIWGNVASIAASIAAGNTAVGNSLNLANQARLSSFGRELELEADEYAAEYLYKSNYAPEEMLGVLGVLKDHQRYNAGGAGGPAYHGLFSSHPRNDKRLQEAIKKAGTLPPGEAYSGREDWRQVLEGVVVGPNFNGNKMAHEERYSNIRLGITFVYPKGWIRTNKGSKIILKNPEGSIQLQVITEKTKDRKLTSTEAINAKYPQGLSDVELINAAEAKAKSKDYGVVAKLPNKRVGLVSIVRNTFHFLGLPRNNKLTAEQDAELVKIIKSFRRVTRKDLPASAVKRISYTRVEPGEMFFDLAQRVGKVTGVPDMEDYLRLLNGYYPKGEPEPGSYIKIIK